MNPIKKILSSALIFVAFFIAGWVTVDLSQEVAFNGLNETFAAISCGGCGGSFGFSDFWWSYADSNSWRGYDEIGGGGGGGGFATPDAPTCTLTLTKNKITWTTTGATAVAIEPTTNSPSVPGASTGVAPNGTVVFSGTWDSVKYGKITQLESELRANGVPGATVNSDHGFYANKFTANRICAVLYPGTVNGTYGSRSYNSPKNNTVFIWGGSSWSQQNAKNYNSHFDGSANFTCVAVGAGTVPDLSGSENFVPPLGVGTHTYKLTATGAGGAKTCTATVVVPSNPDPAPVCTLDLTKNKITWTSQHANTVTIVPLTNSPQVPGGSTSNNGSGGSSNTPSAIFSEGFETNPYTNGWVLTNNAGTWKWRSSGGNTHIHSGTHSMNAGPNQDGGRFTDTITRSVSTEGYSSVTLSYWFLANDLRKGKDESLFVEWTADGSTWNVAFKIDDNNDDNKWYTRTHTLPASAANNPNFAVRFRAHLHGDHDDVWIDDITISGISTNSGGSGNGPLALSGMYTFVPPLGVGTHTYKLTATGPSGSEMCEATVVVPPTPEPSCTLTATPSDIYDGDSVELQWTSSNVSSGSINQGVGAISPVASGSKTVTPHVSKTYTATFTGSYGDVSCSADVTVTPPPVDSVTIKATKIVCDYESDLPNWSGGSTNITANTATDFLSTHSDCRLEPDWSFEYASGNTSNPGDNTIGSTGGSWTLFSDDNDDGVSVVTIAMSAINNAKLWVREVNKAGYIPFTGILGSNVSAEMYCGTDVKNYDNYDFIENPAVDATYYCIAFNVEKPTSASDPSCTLSADPTSIDSGETSTLTWTTTNATSFTINNGIGNVTPVSGGSTETQALTTTTTFVGTVQNASGSATCSVDIGVLPSPVPFCTLSVTPTNIISGQSVSLDWTSGNVTSGSLNQGIGSLPSVSNGTINDLFPSDDTTYTATFTGPHGDISCSATVDVDLGGGGCQGNCGGGLNQPNVSLASAPGGTVLGASFVSLSQIPYTGFEAGAFLTMLFWLAVVLWSVGITYIFMGKGSMQFVAERVMSLAGMSGYAPQYDYDREDMSYENGHDATYNQSVAYAPPVPQPAVAPAPTQREEAHTTRTQVAVDGLPALSDVIESRAHAAGVLLSPEAVVLVSTLHTDRAEALRVFGDILNEAVRTIQREDGWILLSADRVRELIQSVAHIEALPTAAIPVAPQSSVAPVLDDSAITRFVGALLSGDRDTAFTLLSKLEHEQASASRFATAVATTLDKLYRARKTGGNFADLSLQEKAAFLSDDGLGQLVEVFAHALDATYASQYTNLKIAIAQAFDIRA